MRRPHRHEEKTLFARRLRRLTKPERKVWYVLRDRRLAYAKFRRQHVLGPFVMDFDSVDLKIAVEVDGPSHEGREAYDRRREAFLQRFGIAVIRIRNEVVLQCTETLADWLAEEIRRRKRGWSE